MAFRGFDKVAYLRPLERYYAFIGVGIDTGGFEQWRRLRRVADNLQMREGHSQPIDGGRHFQEAFRTRFAGRENYGIEHGGWSAS